MASKMSKNILVPEKMLCDIYRLILYLEDAPISDEAKLICASIESAVDDKIRKRELRKLFTAYKTAPPGQERETLRLEYINLAHIHRNFISNQETPYSSL